MRWMATLKGYINHIIDPSNFWIQIGSDADFETFQTFSEELNRLYKEKNHDFKMKEESLYEGQKVMVAASENHWNRAQIARINEDTLDVFYIDLGFTEIVNNSQVRFISQKIFDFIPPQVRKMGLAGIRPLSPSWTSRSSQYFSDLVLHQNVIVIVVDTDPSQSYSLGLIFICSEDGTWTSVTEKMINDEMGVSSGMKFVTSLSKELVPNLEEPEKTVTDPSEYSQVFLPPENETTFDKTDQQNLTDHTQQINSVPADASKHNEISDQPESPVYVPAPNWHTFKQTTSLTLSQLQELKRVSHKKDLDCKGDGKKFVDDFDWGRTDLCVGQADVFNDHDSISHQIRINHSRDCATTEEDIFPHRKLKDEVTSTQQSVGVEENESNIRLSEPAAYKLVKRITNILQNESQDEEFMVCQLVHDIIEPDLNVSSDHLNVVIASIIESLINDDRLEVNMALAVLDTYTVCDLFQVEILKVFKTLKDRYVRLPQSVRLLGHHLDFVRVLALIFNHSVNWSTRLSQPFQDYAVKLMERCTIFNKQRQQDIETSLNTEIIYLECVNSFMMNCSLLMIQLMPDIYAKLIDEMKEKLLHDSTPRSVRQFLLNMLLKYQTPSFSIREVAVQTEVSVSVENSAYIAPSKKDRSKLLNYDSQPERRFNSHLQLNADTGHRSEFDLEKFEGFESVSITSKAVDQDTTDECMTCKTITNSTCDNIYLGEVPASPHFSISSHFSNPDIFGHRESHTLDELKPYQMFTDAVEKISLPSSQRIIQYSPQELIDMNPLGVNYNKTAGEHITEPSELLPFSNKKDLREKEKEPAKRNDDESSVSKCNKVAHQAVDTFDQIIESSSQYIPHLDNKKISLQCIAADLLSSDGRDGELQQPNPTMTHDQYSFNADISNNDRLRQPKPTMTRDQYSFTSDSSNVERLQQSKPTVTGDQHFFYADSTNAECHPAVLEKRGKSGKKKTKFQPFRPYLDLSKDKEAGFQTLQDSEDKEDFDEMSLENLKLYEELENEQKLKDITVIHPSRLGAASVSSSKRSLLPDYTEPQPRANRTLWCPSKWHCTRCNSESHTVYDCPEKAGFDNDYMLI
ncbi:hypothetical protein Btru_059866 [Bulinus truncatus]|nr:hypothetical protein Btru_059866 [Bulinus truncatus]